MRITSNAKEVFWIASAREDLRRFPEAVRQSMGYALYLAQTGDKHSSVKPLKGFGSAGVLEIVEDHEGDTYRAVYTVRFKNAIYVLHAFQKKSKRGIETPKPDTDTIRRRLKLAADHYAACERRSEDRLP